MPDVIIKPDGTEVAPPEPAGDDGTYSLEQLQSIVGGYIEILTAGDGRKVIFDEEGKLKELTPNMRATALVELFQGDYLVGDVLLCDEERLQ